MPLARPFAQIDVFSAVPCAGNPVAVVLDGQGLDAALTEVRAFAAPIGVPEDPVTGSLNASLAQWLIAAGELPASYIAAQGTALGRAGRVHVERDADGQVWVGGDCVRVVQGEVLL